MYRHPAPASRRGFTLVELLVVIGIIALLISILLPSLNAARKQADRVKCLAALQQLGQATFMYSNDNQGWMPPAKHQYNSPTGAPREKRWHDFIGKYVNGNRPINANGTQIVNPAVDPIQIWSVKDSNNILWGCPQWKRVTKSGAGFSIDDNSPLTASRFHPGYAFNPYPKNPGTTTAQLVKSRSIVNTRVTPATGTYFRQSAYVKPSENALIAESVHGDLLVPSILGGWPYQPDTNTPMPAEPDVSGSVYLSLDFNRHGKKPTGNKPGDASMNMLFADGHADTVSTRAAYRAITKR